MGSPLEWGIVAVIVLATLLWALRGLMRTMKRTGGCSSCATSGDCPVAKDPDLITDLLDATRDDCGRTPLG